MDEKGSMELMNGFLEWAKSAPPEEITESLIESNFENFLGIDEFDFLDPVHGCGPFREAPVTIFYPNDAENTYSYAMAA
jgi:hypothetical protein